MPNPTAAFQPMGSAKGATTARQSPFREEQITWQSRTVQELGATAESAQKASAETKIVRVREGGQMTLPAEIIKKYHIQEGDLIGFRETQNGLLVDLTAVEVARALDEIGAGLREKEITLEEMIESGREIRGELLKEMYGIDADDES